MLEDLDALHTSLLPSVQDLRGTLRIGAIGSMATGAFSRMIGSFFARHPEVRFRLVQAGSLELREKLQRGELDVAFITSTQQPEADTAIRMTTISSFSYFLAVPKGHRLAQEQSVRLSDLREERFVFHDDNLAMYQICLNACRAAGFEPKIVCTTTHTWFRYYMVEAGLGIGLFPYEDFLSFPPNRVVRLRIQPAIEPLLSLAVPGEREDNPLVDSFLSFVHSWTTLYQAGLHNDI